jgi:hypothetical protein
VNVKVAEPAEVVLRNASEEDRRRVWAWIDNLKRWETDPFIRQHSKKLEDPRNAYMLWTTTDIVIFFELQPDSITVLDVAKKATILSSGPG